MEGRDVDEKMQRRDRVALGGPNVDGGWGAWCVLESQCAGALS